MTLNGKVWTPIGPSPISLSASVFNGLVSAIAINPSNPNVIYMGTAGGGMWRSIDGGLTWIPLFDRQLSLGVGEPGAIAIDPINTNVIYVGTSSRINAEPQAGLFKSADGGSSWIKLGAGYPIGNSGNASQFVNQWINVIVVDPANSNILYLASTSGVFRSTDAGLNWTIGSNSGGDARSLVLDTSAAGPRILYTGVSGRGVFRSNDGGLTWTQILSAATPAVVTALGSGTTAGFGKVAVDLAPPASSPNPTGIQVIYASLQGTGGAPPPSGTGAPDPVGVFVSTDQGATWTQQAGTGMPTNTQGGYSFHMAVDPASPGDGINDIIYFGCVGQTKSSDSGNNFTNLTGLHADTHAWVFVPQPSPTPSVVYSGNDGGLFKSTNGGVTWTALNSGGLQTGLFYNINIKPDAAGSFTLGALQDNGSFTTSTATGLQWKGTQGGDGWDIAYDGTIAGQVYCTSGFWSPAPCTRVWRSTNEGLTFTTDITPWGTTTDAGCYLSPIATDPTTGGMVYVSGSQNLWQSFNGGNSWRIISTSAAAGDVDVSRTNGNYVVFAAGTQVFVSTNSLLGTVGPPSGVTFTNITRNLPNRNVARVLFDPNDPTTIYAVLSGFNGGPGNIGHVFRTSITSTVWTDISPNIDAPFSAIALDGTDTPCSIYAGTEFGVLRSVDGGLSWSVLDDIHFPRVPVLDLEIRNGALRAATYGRGAFAFVNPTGPTIAVNLEHNLAFGTICQGPQYLTLQIFNVGVQDLVIQSVQRLMGSTSFSVLPTPGTPLVIAAGEHVDFTVEYQPSGPIGSETATIRIISNDPSALFLDLSATGIIGTPSVVTAIPDNGNMGSVCLGSYSEAEFTINNTGSCALSIYNISSSSSDFVTPQVTYYPLVIYPGNSIQVTIRFAPTSFGTKSAILTLLSNDPAGLQTVSLSGVVPTPRLSLLIANAGNFGNVCIGSHLDKPLMLANSGQCTLSIANIASSATEFIVPQVSLFPVTISPGCSLEIPIRFEPASFGSKSATITITSDDPTSPMSIGVSGYTPSGKLVVTGSTCFGGVRACCCEERTISVCNVGDCDLHVTSVAFKRKNRHWKLVNNPFPSTLHPGSCLGVTILYKATEKCPRCMELVIASDDPNVPEKILDMMAYTIWGKCDCQQCCEECKKGSCNESHREYCCEKGQSTCCCDDDYDDEINNNS